MPPKAATGDGSTANATSDRQKLEFVVRLLYKNCPNPSLANFEFNGMKYKTAWGFLDRIKKEILSTEEISALKNDPKDSVSVGNSEIHKKAIPKRKVTTADTPKRTSKKSKVAMVEKDVKEEMKTESEVEDGEIKDF